MWFLYNKVILSKDNLTKWSWSGCKNCAFCDADDVWTIFFMNVPSIVLFRELFNILINIPHQITIQICLEID
jgi:hypothetical protein